MGYTTEFEGQFNLDRALEPHHAAYLRQFSYTCRMTRNPIKAAAIPDPYRTAVGLEVGKHGEYFVGTDQEHYGQDRDCSIVDYNTPPDGQPSLWCQWVPDESGRHIQWDEGEKFYEYEAWLEYLIEHFLQPWGYTLNGKVIWQGEDDCDTGVLIVENNKVWTEVIVT